MWPLFTSHNFFHEGGRKTHITAGKGSLCGRPEAHSHVRNHGDHIKDLEVWVRGASEEVCKICLQKARKIQSS